MTWLYKCYTNILCLLGDVSRLNVFFLTHSEYSDIVFIGESLMWLATCTSYFNVNDDGIFVTGI